MSSADILISKYLEKMKANLESKIEQLQRVLSGNIENEENKRLKKLIEDKDKLLKKNAEKHEIEVKEVKMKQKYSLN